MTEILRTPESRFRGLPAFGYEPGYVDVDVDGTSLRLARVDEGEGHPVVLLHGEPTWGFLYRRLLPPLRDAGLRVILPDHPGFGRSDKPADRSWFTYDRLVASFDAHMVALDLDEPATLVVHDWGGPIGLRWATQNPDAVARLVILDTGLYAPGGEPSEDWMSFRRFVEDSEELPISMLVQGGAAGDLSEEVLAGYEAPFHEPAAQAGAVMLPLLIPLGDDDPGAQKMWEANQALGEWDSPTLILWGEDDDILPTSIGARWAEQIPGCVGMETFTPASHFLQEDQGPALGARIATFVTTGS